MIRSLSFLGATLLLVITCAAQQKSKRSAKQKFQKHIIDTGYISEGVAVADVNKDGQTDILAGSFWWEAPHWTRHEITTPYIHPSIDGYGNSFLVFSQDVNGDGWDDELKIGFPAKEAFWFENPKGAKGHWTQHLIYPSVGNESPVFIDIDGDGKKDLLCNDPEQKKVIWVSPPRTNSDTGWTAYTISSDTLIGTHMYTHGLGYGDINGDGRKDVLIKDGWWEGPADPRQPGWRFHPGKLSDECAQMYTIDLDHDGDSDVISSSAHNYGLWWHEQRTQGDSTAWIKHDIYTAFSQSHGLAMEDMDKDGDPDLVTGKRFWAHNGHDPGEREPAVIYIFEYKPGQSPAWTPMLVDDNSGIGLHVVTADMNKDGRKDIVISNKKGVFYFEKN